MVLSACSKNVVVIDSTKLLRSKNYRVANNRLQSGASIEWTHFQSSRNNEYVNFYYMTCRRWKANFD